MTFWTEVGAIVVALLIVDLIELGAELVRAWSRGFRKGFDA